MKIALQPSANKEAQKNYNKTIHNKVNLDSIESNISQTDYQELLKIYPDKQLMIWGVTSLNLSKWDNLLRKYIYSQVSSLSLLPQSFKAKSLLCIFFVIKD